MPNEICAEIVDAYESFYGSVYGYCAYRLFSKDLAEDAVAEVFLRLVAKYRQLRGWSRSDLCKWLFGTARNVVARHLRDAKRRRQITEELAGRKDHGVQAPEDQGHLDWPVLYEAMSRLSLESQEIVALRYFRGLNASEIAEILGLSHGAVRAKLSRAVGKLRCELGKRFGEQNETT